MRVAAADHVRLSDELTAEMVAAIRCCEEGRQSAPTRLLAEMTVTDATPATLVLRPARRAAAWWTVLASLPLATMVWAFVDSDGHAAAWVGLTLAAVVFLALGAQLVAPSWFAVRLAHDAVRARLLWLRTEVRWDEVMLARVGRLAGEPTLELEVRRSSGTGDPWTGRSIGILLPLGADVEALHRFLAARLGTTQHRPRSRPAGRVPRLQE